MNANSYFCWSNSRTDDMLEVISSSMPQRTCASAISGRMVQLVAVYDAVGGLESRLQKICRRGYDKINQCSCAVKFKISSCQIMKGNFWRATYSKLY